jgi:hypothetical protein
MREIGHVHLLYDSVGPYLTVKSIADAIEPIPRLCEQRSDFGNSATHSQLASIEEATQTAARARPRRTALSGRKIAALQKIEGLSQLETQFVGDRLRAEKHIVFE